MLTIDTVLKAARDLADLRPLSRPDPFSLIGRCYGAAPFGTMRVITDANCLEETRERLFPESKHRSARIRKKLIKRFGGEFRKRPTMFIVAGDTIICHPALAADVFGAIPEVDRPAGFR